MYANRSLMILLVVEVRRCCEAPLFCFCEVRVFAPIPIEDVGV